MKKSISLFAISALVFLSFRAVPVNRLPLCNAINAILKEEPGNFAALKGGLVSDNADGSKNYALTIKADGWASNELAVADGAVSIDIKSESTSKLKATELFNATTKQLNACLAAKPQLISAEGIDQLLVYTKGKVEVGLMLVTNEGKTFVLISVSRS